MIKKPVSTAKKSIEKIQTFVNNPALRSITERRTKKIPRFEKGQYYRIVVRPRDSFTAFKSEPMSDDGMLQQIHGRLPNKKWTTHAWLVDQKGANKKGSTLVGTTASVTHLFRVLNKKITHVEDDIYKLK